MIFLQSAKDTTWQTRQTRRVETREGGTTRHETTPMNPRPLQVSNRREHLRKKSTAVLLHRIPDMRKAIFPPLFLPFSFSSSFSLFHPCSSTTPRRGVPFFLPSFLSYRIADRRRLFDPHFFFSIPFHSPLPLLRETLCTSRNHHPKDKGPRTHSTTRACGQQLKKASKPSLCKKVPPSPPPSPVLPFKLLEGSPRLVTPASIEENQWFRLRRKKK